MEKRLSIRGFQDINISLYLEGFPVTYYVTKDIGPGGMCLNTKSKFLKENMLVRIGYDLFQNGVVEQLFLPARIVHVSKNGVGLMFLKSNKFNFNYPHQMLARLCAFGKPNYQAIAS